MKKLIISTSKKSTKETREKRVLLALMDHYIKTGKPVGSHTLKESEIEDLSSATIRNYFANLEKDGFLIQQHTSGGRIPTDKAYALYANEKIDSTELSYEGIEVCKAIRSNESREVAHFLQEAVESLSTQTNSAVFLSAPRFDNDLVIDMRIVCVDHARCLVILITDFGVVKSELIHIERKITPSLTQKIEEYFTWRLTGIRHSNSMTAEEELFAQKIYNEAMLRYVVSYSNFIDEEIYRTGFSKLIAYPEFQDPSSLASSLALFENAHSMKLLLKECCAMNRIKFWIGDALDSYTALKPNCSIVTVPYHINKQPVGAIGILCPIRMPYGEVFALLRGISSAISETLTRNLCKLKINYRQPQKEPYFLNGENQQILLENKLKDDL